MNGETNGDVCNRIYVWSVRDLRGSAVSEFMELSDRMRRLLKEIEHAEYTGEAKKRNELVAEYARLKTELGLSQPIEKLFGVL